MQDNIRIYFTEKVKFEQIIKKNYEFNCTINSNDIKIMKQIYWLLYSAKIRIYSNLLG